MVCKLVYPHSVFELSADSCMVRGGVPGLLYVLCAVTVHCTAGGGGGWHKALVVGSVILWRRLLASRL